MKFQLNEKIQEQFLKEGCFEVFKSHGLICCIQRMQWTGNLNGYVAVPRDNRFYGKDYRDHIVTEKPMELEFNGNYIGALCLDKDEFDAGIIPMDVFINVHCGLTYADKNLKGIEDGLFGDVWWFGFDTSHSGDMKVLLTDIDLKYDCLTDGEYRDFNYVKSECIKLAEQLSK